MLRLPIPIQPDSDFALTTRVESFTLLHLKRLVLSGRLNFNNPKLPENRALLLYLLIELAK